MSNRQLDEEAIFHVARQLETQEARLTYLDQICAGDQALRERVERLLQVHEQEQNFLKSDNQLHPTVDRAEMVETVGQQIGRYKLLQKIGEGGFGVVYLAEQVRPVRRKVALKVIKPGMDTHAVVARFEAERQALALMDHPNIARVLDGGATERGRPYFIMELVKGVPITEFCDKNQLSTGERLKLIVTVCQAVQHAHQKGIIHRDLKPSNILVTLHDGRPVIKVIDFGVAKAINQQLTEKTLFTAFGQMVGTPQYMSPEQAELSGLDIDTRSDIYALGVVLYELLTGSTPLEAERLRHAGYAELQRLIKEQEPPKPSTRLSSSGEKLTIIAQHRSSSPAKLSAIVKGDLDWIVMKALDKDRSRRYPTASALAADIERFSNDEPVEACPPSSGYRLRKFYRRNRPLLLSGLGVIVLLIAGILGTTSGLVWALRERGKAELALNSLKDELLDRAFDLALSGDKREAEDALERAQQAGAPTDLVRAIKGIAHLHGGEVETAIESFEAAMREDPNNPVTICSAIWAYYFAGQADPMSRTLARLGEVIDDEAVLDDHTQLLLAQVKVFGTDDLSGLIGDLDRIIDKHPRWGVAYAVRAEAKSQLGQLTKDLPTLNDAANDADKALHLTPDNAVVLAAGMLVYTYLIQLERHEGAARGETPTRAERQAAEFAQRLDDWDHHLEARMRRLLYYRLIGNTETYRSEYQALLDLGIGAPQPELGQLLVLDDPSRLDDAVEKYDSFAVPRMIRALRHVVDNEEERALELFQIIQDECEAIDHRALALDIPKLAQRPEIVAATANQLINKRPTYDPPNIWRCEWQGVRFAAGDVTAEELLELAGPFHYEQCMAHFYIGMQAIADGNSPDARSHLEIAADCAAPGWWCTVFSEAYLRLMDEGRIPIRKSTAP